MAGVLAGGLPPRNGVIHGHPPGPTPRTTRLRYALPGAAVEPLSGDYVLAVTGTGDLTFKRLISDDGRILLR